MSDTSRADVARRVVAVIADVCGRSPSEVPLDAPWADLDVDSLDLIDLVVRWEETFGITIADRELMQLRTAAEVAAFVTARV